MTTDPKLIPQLIETNGRHSGRVHQIPYGEHFLGRSGDVSVVLDHPDVSRRHARLEVGPDGVIVYDLGSKNGIVVDGERIVAPVSLGHGQIFCLGDLRLAVSHPAWQVSKALTRAGEATLTTTRTVAANETEVRPSLIVPVAGVVVFGVLVALMLLL
jgi:pSer/pThr/pTyr-binding forkhead associated (FHA) protein